jgi:hypothetical protein
MDIIKKRFTDTRLSEVTTIPRLTLAEWKKLPSSDWRRVMYDRLQKADEEELYKDFILAREAKAKTGRL